MLYTLWCHAYVYANSLQEVYHTTHQCFYSRRSMYLALFRLTDGEEGIEELEQWLRIVQVRMNSLHLELYLY